MKSQLGLFCLILFLGLGVGCGKDETESAPGAPSVRGDFKETYDFFLAALDKSVASGLQRKLPDAEFAFLDQQLEKMRTMAPVSGMTARGQLDSQGASRLPLRFDNGQPAIRIDQIDVWVFCKEQVRLDGLNWFIDDVKAGEIRPSGRPYPENPPNFSYDTAPAQYRALLSYLVAANSTFKINLGGNGCVARTLVRYSQYEPATITALGEWRVKIAKIQQDLKTLNSNSLPSNFPMEYQLKKISADLTEAYNALP